MSATQSSVIQSSSPWGQWKDLVSFNDYNFLCGAQIKYFDPVSNQNKLGATGIKLFSCQFGNWNNRKYYLEQQLSLSGNWKQEAFCPTDSFVVGFQVRFQPDQGNLGDNSAVNGLKFVCKNPQLGNKSTILVHQGSEGQWQQVLQLKDQNQYIAKYKLKKGTDQTKDRTGLNAFYFESIKYEPQFFQITDYHDIPTVMRIFPQLINSKEIMNCMNVSVKKIIFFNKIYEFYDEYINSNAFIFGTKIWAKAEVNVLGIGAQLKAQTKLEYQKNFTFNKRQLKRKRFVDVLEIECPPSTSCLIQQMILQTELRVPYNGFAIYPRGQKLKINGNFFGSVQGQSYDVVKRKVLTDQSSC